MSKSAQLIIVSDLHVGSKIGLMPPTVELDDGNVVSYNKVQKQAWDFWTRKFWPEVAERAKTRETRVVLNGDLIDGGRHHNTNQVWSNDDLEQIEVAADILKDIAAKYPVHVTRGTPAHVQSSAAADEAIAREIGAIRPSPKNKARSSYHLRLDFAGVRFDLAHHGPAAGTRLWTYGNALRSYARTIVLDALVRRRRAPDCIIRSHVHHRTHETLNDYGHRCEGIITPAWQWATEFVHKVISHEDVADIGGCIVSIDNGRISNIEFLLLELEQSDLVIA